MLNDLLQALARLTPREQYDRAYRFKLASQSSVQHKPLPKEQWTPASEVCPALFFRVGALSTSI